MKKLIPLVMLSFVVSCGVPSESLISTPQMSESYDFAFVTESLKEEEATLQIGRARVAGTWFLPQGEQSESWVVLQHGFQRNRGNMRDLAQSLAKQGIPVLTLSLSTDQLNSAGFIADFAKVVSDKEKPVRQGLPEHVILAGHSLGGLYASRVGAELVKQEGNPLKGLLLLDPVDRDRLLKTAFDALKGKTEVLNILAEPGQCNSQSNATGIIPSLEQGFSGVRLTRGSHCDAEGDSSNWMCSLMCGASSAQNKTNLKDFAQTWIKGLAQGEHDPTYLPGGEHFEEMQRAGSIRKL